MTRAVDETTHVDELAAQVIALLDQRSPRPSSS